MVSSTKPTVLFIHGSWHTPKHFAPVRSIFEEAGYLTSCPRLPTVGALPPVGLMDDAQCIQNELVRLIVDEGKNVIVIAHSYGGVVATQAVTQEFAKDGREAEGQKGGVERLVYMCAFLLPPGNSLETALGGELPPFIPVDEKGMCMMLDPAHRFYNDLSEAEQQKWVSELMECPAIAQQTTLTHVAYLHHPVTYLFCENDQALPFEVQKTMVGGVKAAGVAIATETCNAGHSPFLSMPERVLKVVDDIAINVVMS